MSYLPQGPLGSTMLTGPMSTPTTTASPAFSGAAVMGFMAAGAVAGAIGSYFNAQAQKDNLRFQADMAEINARIAEKGAQSVLLQGQREQQRVRLRTAKVKSASRVAMAANGIDLGSDTAQNILNTTDIMGEIDANTVEANAVQAAWGYRMGGVNQQMNAGLMRSQASGINPTASAVSSTLDRGSQVAANWYFMNRAGAFN